MRIENHTHVDAEELRQLFYRLRGSAVSAFAEAEFAMGNLLGAIERAGCVPGVEFSYKAETRVKEFRRVCMECTDDVSTQQRIVDITSAFEATIDDRNALVHGTAKLIPESRIVEVLKFSPHKSDKHRLTRFIYKLDAMEDRVRVFDSVSRQIIGLSWFIAQKFGLIDDALPSFSVEVEDF